MTEFESKARELVTLFLPQLFYNEGDLEQFYFPLVATALRAAHKAGRAEGIEEAAKVCEHISKREEYIARDRNIPANEFLSQRCAEEIRALAKGEKG
jgi:hypothetical protein